ncbi:N-acetylglucosamine kinase [Streptosporangium saharense]|uniref:N-acetylglucosamine kinase-like BadF-type ATPase n=1 Tax=Streptosporangium saharense TaxID=1706840 RepID=A0A7W7QUW0_9ACTN|nr:BadF/BadG/BcrA/BcrD ATPase family protein [Streptosporangium saharense]MBB4919958.1 N-acetylglucosamine kinase-like BadF-type ATPase [Streptosporangium saharense]
MTALVVGLDGGGTGTRCVVATLSGEITGRGYGGAANALSSPDPALSLGTALRTALDGLDPARVVGGVLALAGARSAPERATAVADSAWRAVGLAGRPRVVPDTLAAFAGATGEPSGTVLVAGTGATAVRIEDRRVTRWADGYGWLLGDEGSGTWIGLRAVRAVLACLDGRAGPTALREAVLGRVSRDSTPVEAGTGGTPVRVLKDGVSAGAVKGGVSAGTGAGGMPVRAARDGMSVGAAGGDVSIGWLVGVVEAGVAREGPGWLARLAPVVEDAARAGDATASGILDKAAFRLTETVLALGPGAGPLVVAGSLLTGPTLLAGRVRALLPGPVLTTRDGAAGAAALALRTLSPGTAEAAHLRLLTEGPPAGRTTEETA